LEILYAHLHVASINPILHCPKDDYLHLNGNGVALRLPEHLDDAFATLDLGLGFGVKVGPNCAKAASSRNCARVLLRRPACFMALICAAEPTRDTDKPTEIAGGRLGRKGPFP
jgi:hypothetical protein